jgi:hypothetical protein
MQKNETLPTSLRGVALHFCAGHAKNIKAIILPIYPLFSFIISLYNFYRNNLPFLGVYIMKIKTLYEKAARVIDPCDVPDSVHEMFGQNRCFIRQAAVLPGGSIVMSAGGLNSHYNATVLVRREESMEATLMRAGRILFRQLNG